MDNETREMFELILSRFDNLEGKIQDVRTELKSEIQDVRNEIQDVRSELKAEIQDVRSELKTEIQDVRTELKSEIQDVRGLIETELRHTIQVIAEGHGKLYEKNAVVGVDIAALQKAQEMNEIRISMLESEVKALKK